MFSNPGAHECYSPCLRGSPTSWPLWRGGAHGQAWPMDLGVGEPYVSSILEHLIVGARGSRAFFSLWSSDCWCFRKCWLLAQLVSLSDFVEQGVFLASCDQLVL